MRKGLYPGSFDPFTNGHLDIVKRGSKLFDKLYVCVADNPNKQRYFTSEERFEMIKEAVKDIPNVEVVRTDGLVVNKAKELGCLAIVRGLRAVTDFEYEFQLAAGYEYIDPQIEMIFLMATEGKGFISSSAVKEFYISGVDISRLVPPVVEEYFNKKNK